MGHLVLAQQGNLTFDQFRWLWIGAMSAFGVIFIIGCLVFKGSQKTGRSQVRQTLIGLIRSGVLREEEIVRALNAPHLPSAPDDMNEQVWLNRILSDSPVIEQLIRLWKRPLWVEASLYAGFGMFLACGVCALLFLLSRSRRKR